MPAYSRSLQPYRLKQTLFWNWNAERNTFYGGEGARAGQSPQSACSRCGAPGRSEGEVRPAGWEPPAHLGAGARPAAHPASPPRASLESQELLGDGPGREPFTLCSSGLPFRIKKKTEPSPRGRNYSKNPLKNVLSPK